MADLISMMSAAAGLGGEYEISRSLRFNSADSAFLNRTPASAGNRKTWTYSTWIKLSAIGSTDLMLFTSRDVGSTYYGQIQIGASGASVLEVQSVAMAFKTTQLFRDLSAWYHIVVSLDTTQATEANRFKLYVNGLQVTAFATATYPSQNADTDFNQAVQHNIGSLQPFSGAYFNGYMTEINFVDGQALTPSDFGEFNSDTGVWQPIDYTGTYGTNGFYLPFSDNASTTTLGDDFSGNGNDWTTNNFSVTAGAGNDSLVDSPTRYGTDTGAGGEVRGNYATLNPLRNNSSNTLANGNLDVTLTDASNSRTTFSTIGLTSGKWYWEGTVTATDAGNTFYPGFGVNTDLSFAPSGQSGDTAAGFMYLKNGQKFNNNTLTNYGSSYTTNDVIGIALDMDAGTITFYKNGSSQGQAFSGISGTAVPCVIGAKGTNNASAAVNFGQRPFAFSAPSGFKALVTTNLP